MMIMTVVMGKGADDDENEDDDAWPTATMNCVIKGDGGGISTVVVAVPC